MTPAAAATEEEGPEGGEDGLVAGERAVGDAEAGHGPVRGADAEEVALLLLLPR
jgi:hypothetical protein